MQIDDITAHYVAEKDRAELGLAIARLVAREERVAIYKERAACAEICDAAVRGETIKLSSFGTFTIRSKKERIGRNPKTGQEAPITPRRVMVFKPSNILKDRVMNGNKR